MAGVTAADVWRIYVKPSMDGRLIPRKKTVLRRSAKVLERNKIFAQKAPQMVLACRGRPWKEYVACLRQKARELGLGTGVSKTPEYRRRFWKHKA